ncbi:MAG: hypothetical protein INR69_01495 [Mucilaginibacter polytrichastri]|nr:hypothetical protein [Mucilaginibacter polytrichastri]
MKAPKIFWKALSFGALAGSRSMAAPALLMYQLSRNPSKKLAATRLDFMQHPAPALAAQLFMAGEFAGDKLPAAPNRIAPKVLLGRALAGALVGATIYAREEKDITKGALIGLGAAVASTYLTFFVRRSCAGESKLRDKVIGVAEDVLAFNAGRKLIETL